MSSFHIFDSLPLWLAFICIIAFILLSTWLGVAFIHKRDKSSKKIEVGHIGTIVGATLGLIAFILAFTFNQTTERFDARKQYLLQEVNSIETTWLRAGLIREPHSSEVKDLLKEYVNIRVEAANHPERIRELYHQSNILEKKIWSVVTDLTNNAPRNDAINALFVEAVNEMFDNQTNRITVTLQSRIPLLIWITFFFLIMISMFAVGVLFGLQKKTDWVIIFALTLAFSAVILVIIDLDSTTGIIQINYQPIFDLYQRLLEG